MSIIFCRHSQAKSNHLTPRCACAARGNYSFAQQSTNLKSVCIQEILIILNTQGRASHEVLHVFDASCLRLVRNPINPSSILPTANGEREGINQEWNRKWPNRKQEYFVKK